MAKTHCYRASLPELLPESTLLQKLFCGKRLSSQLFHQVRVYLQHLLGRHLIVNLRSELPFINKGALRSNEEESIVDSKNCLWCS